MEVEAAEAGAVEKERGRLAGLSSGASLSPPVVAGLIVASIAVALIVTQGLQPFGQTTVNGLISASYFALGAVGLTLVYGTLKLVNFAHGDLLTLGAYVAFVANVSLGLPILLAVLCSVAVVAAFGVATERVMWRPMRAKGAGLLQLLIMTLGLAFVIRYSIQLFAGTQPRSLEVDVTSSTSFVGLTIGQTQLIVVLAGFAVLLAVGAALRFTSLGKQMRALSDNFELAEVAGINTDRVVLATWIFAAGLAGLAGVLYTSAIGNMTPNLGFFLLLSLFAAVILGGIGNAYGALAGGVLLGLTQEWSTLLVDARWKLAVGFLVLILVLVVRPQGLFGRQERAL
ncbi:MAG: branched-chain amino acid ABC transporter permease [Solirubrobacteraceae bacterium MAG38_C4-C5]|nr:branched-chain amino acid ABC transporter permease [Candidatus Siliceabacter maunaloa]